MLRSPATSCEVRRLDADAWHRLLLRFDDAVLHQTWSYGADHWGEENLRHFLLERDGRVVAAGQLALARLPFIASDGVCLDGGPIWRLRDEPADPALYQEALRALRTHCVEERGYHLRVMPRIYEGPDGAMRHLTESCGLAYRPGLSGYPSFLLDLSHPLGELQDGLRGSFREGLAVAWEQPLLIAEVFENETGPVLERFLSLDDVRDFRAIQDGLPPLARLKLVACWHEGRPVAAALTSALGDTAVTPFISASPTGERLGAVQALRWWLVQWLKFGGFRFYDLGAEGGRGIDAAGAGFAPELGRQVELVGAFDGFEDVGSQLVVRLGDRLRETQQRARALLSAA